MAMAKENQSLRVRVCMDVWMCVLHSTVKLCARACESESEVSVALVLFAINVYNNGNMYKLFI